MKGTVYNRLLIYRISHRFCIKSGDLIMKHMPNLLVDLYYILLLWSLYFALLRVGRAGRCLDELPMVTIFSIFNLWIIATSKFISMTLIILLSAWQVNSSLISQMILIAINSPKVITFWTVFIWLCLPTYFSIKGINMLPNLKNTNLLAKENYFDWL